MPQAHELSPARLLKVSKKLQKECYFRKQDQKC